MKKLNYLLFILFLLPCMLIGQSTFQDSEGKSSIVINQGGIGQINITDATIKIGYLYYDTKYPFRFGIEVSGKATNGFATLFKKEEVVPEAKMKISFGYHELLKKKSGVISDDWLTFQVGYQRGNYKLFDPAMDYEHQIRKEKFDGFSAMIYYNMILKGSVLIGISLGIERQNNYQYLEKVEINDITTVSENDKTIRRISSTQELRQGEYKKNDHFLANFDILWEPDFFSGRLGIDLFGRYDSTKNQKAFKPGVGIFILKKEAPTKVIGGITFEMVEKQLQIGLTAGIDF